MPDLSARLQELDRRGERRQRRVVTSPQGPSLEVDGQRCLAFCSNDYLGLANHPALIEAARRGALEYGVGASASHLISGHCLPHETLEEELAAFVGLPRALYFSSGYMANTGTIPALVGAGDVIFSDALNHACLIDGARLSRAEVRVYPHCDHGALAGLMESVPAKHRLVISDCVFSMDGDIAPLQQLAALCDRYDAWLLVDDAHGFGVLGRDGRGALDHLQVRSRNVIYMATLGKAAGASGAFVAAQHDVVEWLRQRARTYVFSTATPPLIAIALSAALRLIAGDSWRRDRLQELAQRLRSGVAGLPWPLMPSDTAIQPLLIGSNTAAMAIMARLREHGIWIPAIRPPTVPEGTARLRISLSAAHTVNDVDHLVRALHAVQATVSALA
jgi:8-amino-7-oxononanoate synthase